MFAGAARGHSSIVGLEDFGPHGIGENGMNDCDTHHFELRFQSLFDSGRGFAFPCDPNGRVDLDRLSERARNNYLYARAMVGRELAMPAVLCSVH
jgi:hypothetical protein